MDDVHYKQSLNTGLLYLALCHRPVKQMLIYFNIWYTLSSAAVIRKCATTLYYLVFTTATALHRFTPANPEKSPVYISTRWVKLPAWPYRGSICQNKLDCDLSGVPIMYASHRIQARGFLSILPLHDLPCSWWLHRHLQRLWCSVAFVQKMKERLIVSCILCTCTKARGSLTLNVDGSS